MHEIQWRSAVDEIQSAGIVVSTRATDRLALAHDASHYLLTPQAVVRPSNAREVADVLAAASRHAAPLTFRSGGTSLSGQAVSSGLLIDTRMAFRDVQVLDDGLRVRCEPGSTVRAVNARLLRHGRKLGPDPASEIACTIGGVVANNSSGMVCGITANTYKTLDSAIFILASGTVVDTSLDSADELLKLREPAIYAGLEYLRDRIRGNKESISALRRLHSIKNTMGYGLNAFVDFERPIDILEHLVVGSEGTLAFIAEATFRTVPVLPKTATGLLVFPNVSAATSSIQQLVAAGFAAIELMDATSLRVGQADPTAPAELRSLAVEEHAALLVEFQEADEPALTARVGATEALFAELPLAVKGEVSTDASRRAQLWHIRKGLFTAVAGSRPSGTTALLEDIAVPLDRLDATCTALTNLFAQHEYEGSVIFGHAKDGNVHFMINERFDEPRSRARYKAFTEDMVALVLSQGGSLKAEHGTGRVMAPFVRRQYGDELYHVMREVKSLFDHASILNPGVLLNDDPAAHLTSLKTNPSIDAEVDRCVECGYCEPVCPSRDLTTTPRERIVLRREIARAKEAGDESLAAQLAEEYEYDAVQTCAVDGLCQTACPVLINTGDLVRRLRSESHGRTTREGWKVAANHWNLVTIAGGAALSAAKLAPTTLSRGATTLGRAVLGRDVVPLYSGDLPGGGTRRPAVRTNSPEAVYFAGCTTAMFGAEQGPGVSSAFLALCDRAGVDVVTPPDLSSLCCGTPWKSKGLADGYSAMKTRVEESLLAATAGGRLPIVCDASSCTEGLVALLQVTGAERFTIVDAVEFAQTTLLPRLTVTSKIASLAIHPTCASSRLGLSAALARIADAVAERWIVPDDWGCCGFAGDRGMLHPELTASATQAEASEVLGLGHDAYASVNRTCEVGMTRATGKPYRHILEHLEERTR